jgi:hypothetical protein
MVIDASWRLYRVPDKRGFSETSVELADNSTEATYEAADGLNLMEPSEAGRYSHGLRSRLFE